MTRIYDRQTQLWQWDDLHRLEADGKAKRYVDQGLWVVKLPEGGSVAVRDAQVLVYDGMNQEQADADAKAEYEAENSWLHHAEAGDWQEAEQERQIEAQRGVVSFEDAWDAADPVHAAERKLRHAGRVAYEHALAEAGGWADQIPQGRVEAICAEILAGEGTSVAAEKAKVAKAALLARFGVT